MALGPIRQFWCLLFIEFHVDLTNNPTEYTSHAVCRLMPGLQMRMDFTSIDVGIFVYHCHLIGHEDSGMMAKIQAR